MKNMFISFTDWKHWPHCMNKFIIYIIQNDRFDSIILIQFHINRSIYFWLNDMRHTWPKSWTIILLICFRKWFVSMLSGDTNWYSLVQVINKYNYYLVAVTWSKLISQFKQPTKLPVHPRQKKPNCKWNKSHNTFTVFYVLQVFLFVMMQGMSTDTIIVRSSGHENNITTSVFYSSTDVNTKTWHDEWEFNEQFQTTAFTLVAVCYTLEVSGAIQWHSARQLI